ncbi:hypothetical protein VHEMI05102 [[Torrubiella] hemipterigena]|uniref:Uncharacterized protein n=1 Tax=[Torrubiella] hemipterigena TaxID=1531966 RepID=A0A0A1TG91_9HYPO|nr:hypothetical protein VHEMI05102 [[Torrubiella] hemipterigena]
MLRQYRHTGGQQSSFENLSWIRGVAPLCKRGHALSVPAARCPSGREALVTALAQTCNAGQVISIYSTVAHCRRKAPASDNFLFKLIAFLRVLLQAPPAGRPTRPL